MLYKDIKRIKELQELHGLSFVMLLFLPSVHAMAVYRFGSFFTRMRVPIVKQLGLLIYFFLKLWVEMSWGISISRHATIGPGVFINHFSGIFVHKDAVIGKNVILSQGVTVGVKGDAYSGAPTIGDDVTIAAGAKILGPVKVGDGATIGANAVVVKDVAVKSVVGGVPAKVIR